MKAGDKVTVTDGSWSRRIEDSKLVAAYANCSSLRGQHWTVVEVGCYFPPEQGPEFGLSQPFECRNDAVIESPNGDVVFIYSGFLKPVKPAHVWEHGDVFETETLSQGRQTMIFLSARGLETCVVFLASNSRNRNASRQLGAYLKNATFLFNIKDKL